MKINWGYKIIGVYLIFVAGIVYLVIRASSQNNDLVTENYYEEELKYQQVIDASGRTALLKNKMSVIKKNDQLIILFPSDFIDKKISGELLLYYPADEKKDFGNAFETDSLKWVQVIPPTATGQYILKIKWMADEKSYYHEESIFL
jgi:hypothetical protein